MKHETLYSLRDVAEILNTSHNEIARKLRRAGYRFPAVKRGQAVYVTVEQVREAERIDREARTVRAPTNAAR